jgi:TonB family protein
MQSSRVLLFMAMILVFPLSALQAQQAPINCKGPLSQEQLIGLLKAKVDDVRVQAIVKQCGVGFLLTADTERRLRAAGASDAVIAVARTRGPKPTPTSIPKEIPPPVDEPPVVGVSGGVGGSLGGIARGLLGGAPPPPPPPRSKKVEPVRVGGQVQESKIIRRVPPIYPELARRAGVEAVVILEVIVDEEGNVTNVRVLRSHPLLEQAAIDAVKQWKYSPTLVNGEPVPVVATVMVEFKLNK